MKKANAMRWSVVASAALCTVPSLAGRGSLAPPLRTAALDTLATDSVMMNRPECDFHELPDSFVPLSGPITDIPEFHDCQRFVGSGQYGALYAIFARFWGDTTVEQANSSNPKFPPNLPIQSTVTPGATGLPMQTELGVVVTISVPTPTAGVPIATIYNYGATETYDPLGIKPGWNCLYLFADPVDGHWRARMVAQGSNRDCRPPLEDPTVADGTELQVYKQTPPGPPPTGALDYPPVARWDWDPVAQNQYIGTWCGGAWCEVTPIPPPEFTPSPSQSISPYWKPIPGKAFGTVEIMSVLKVKGWYDEQSLAITPGGGAGLMPGSARGTIFPHPALGQLSETDFVNKWVHVASARLTGPPGKYDTQFGFREGTSAMSLCRGTWPTCYAASGAAAPAPRPPTCTAPADGSWWAMIQPARRGAFERPRLPIFRCVARRAHTGGFRIPGVARWRWKETDEKVWVRCGPGCCELQ